MTGLTITTKKLLSPYLLMPVSVFVVLVDMTLGIDIFKGVDDPEAVVLFTLFFTLPHIIASFFWIADREYRQHYSKKLVKGAQLVAITSLVLPLISIRLAFFVFALLTMNHVFFQQSGVAKMFKHGNGKPYRLWQYLGVLISFIIYLVIYSDVTLNNRFIFLLLFSASLYLLVAVMVGSVFLTRSGRLYFWCTAFLPIMSLLFVLTDYRIIAIALPRIVHDWTGYLFYISHDYNREIGGGRNSIYSGLTNKYLFIGYNIVCSVGIAYIVSKISILWGMFPLMFLFLYHYYTDGFVWKHNQLHRKNLKISL